MARKIALATLPHAHLLTAINLCIGKPATAQHQFTGRFAKDQKIGIFEILFADGFEQTIIFKILFGVGATNDIGLPGQFFRTK